MSTKEQRVGVYRNRVLRSGKVSLPLPIHLEVAGMHRGLSLSLSVHPCSDLQYSPLEDVLLGR